MNWKDQRFPWMEKWISRSIGCGGRTKSWHATLQDQPCATNATQTIQSDASGGASQVDDADQLSGIGQPSPRPCSVSQARCCLPSPAKHYVRKLRLRRSSRHERRTARALGQPHQSEAYIDAGIKRCPAATAVLRPATATGRPHRPPPSRPPPLRPSPLPPRRSPPRSHRPLRPFRSPSFAPPPSLRPAASSAAPSSAPLRSLPPLRFPHPAVLRTAPGTSAPRSSPSAAVIFGTHPPALRRRRPPSVSLARVPTVPWTLRRRR